jgi:hypothetical protein
MKAKVSPKKRVSTSRRTRRGNRANSPKMKTDKKMEYWRRRYANLKTQRDQLQVELGRVQKECDDYRRAVLALMHEDIDFDKETLLAECRENPTLPELIAELEA